MCVLMEPLLFITIPTIRVKQTTLWLAPLVETIEGASFDKLLVKKKAAVKRRLVLLQEATAWARLTQRNSLSSRNWTANIHNLLAEISVLQHLMCFPVEEPCKVFPLFWVCFWWRWKMLLGLFSHNKLPCRFVRDVVCSHGTRDLYCTLLTDKVGFTDKQYRWIDGKAVVTFNGKELLLFWSVHFTSSFPAADQNSGQAVLLETGWLFGTADTVQWCLWKCKLLCQGGSPVSGNAECATSGEEETNQLLFVHPPSPSSPPWEMSSVCTWEFWYPLLKTLQWRRDCVYFQFCS